MLLSYLKSKVPPKWRYSHYLHKLIFYKKNIKNYLTSKKIKNSDLSCNNFSLTVGSKLHLNVPDNIELISNNDKVVIKNGIIEAYDNVIGAQSNAVITSKSNKSIRKFYITIVDWIANKSVLKIHERLPNYKILAYEGDKLYFSIAKSLYYTRNAFKTKEYISRLQVLPAQSPPMLVTPVGYFIVGERKISWSKDLINWIIVHKVKLHGVRHSFDYYYDAMKEICYVYYGEYNCNPNDRHKVYRGTIHLDGKQYWETILDFKSINEYKCASDNLLIARHIHIVTVDKQSGHLWVGVGDEDRHSKILFSTDNGNSFYLLGTGSQEWRCLSIWFTERYVYWNMDTHEPQKIFRIKKEQYLEHQKIQKRYPSDDLNYENIEKELVAKLFNGALFSHCVFRHVKYGDIILMASSPEGNIRDMNGRVFGIKELDNEDVVVQELISVSPKNINAKYEINMFTLLLPELVDNEGNIYLKMRNLKLSGLCKAQLIWRD